MLGLTLTAAWKRCRGALRERWGEWRGNDLLAHAGRRERLSGQLDLRYGRDAEVIRRRIDAWSRGRAARRLGWNSPGRTGVGARGSTMTRTA